MYEDIDEIQTGVIAVLYGKYRFSSVFEDDAVLPEYKGSAFRGIFGQALKHVVCALKRQDCRECLLRQKCLYATTFEAFADNSETSARKRIAVPPHPYVIEPPYTTQPAIKRVKIFISICFFSAPSSSSFPILFTPSIKWKKSAWENAWGENARRSSC
jgi:hypothetical protein